VPAEIPTDVLGRYPIAGEIGRGGMGAVLLGRDTDLKRDLAIKVLLHDADPDLLRRFVEEAQIGGQLQHPGIVPIYEIGLYADKRPYFTMKLVQGRTLTRLLAERPSPTHDSPRFLTIFQQVCQTLAYAHSRGVVHRDLKPSNIMVGAFGEVQVMDWGLAKVLPRTAGAGQTEAAVGVQTVRTEWGEGAASCFGTVVGTPSYMAPEQARGQVDRLDERTDVFGLGSILCEILTGLPAYEGTDSDDTFRLAEQANLEQAQARLNACGADAELIRLAHWCLELDPAQRPRHAGEVADAITAYLAGVQQRLRQAELERAAAEARAQEARAKAAAERRARRLTLGLALLTVFTLVAAVLISWSWWDQRARTRQAVEADLEQAEQWRRQANWTEALAAAERAQGRLAGGGFDDLAGRVRKVRADLDMVARLDRLHLANLDYSEERDSREGQPQEYARLFRDHGIDLEALPAEEAARRIAASAIRAQLVAALDDWATAWQTGKGAVQKRVLTVANLADADERCKPFRNAWLKEKWKELRHQLSQTQMAELPPPTIRALALAIGHRDGSSAAIAILQEGQRQYPGDVSINHTLAFLLLERGNFDEAVGYWRAALGARPDCAGLLLNLGNLLHKQGKVVEAEAAYRKALALAPDYAGAHQNLGFCLRLAGKLNDAERSYREAWRLRPRSPDVLRGLGQTLQDLGRYPETEKLLRQVKELEPKNALNYEMLGQVLRVQGKQAEAEAVFREWSRLPAASPVAPERLALVLKEQGKLAEAEKTLRALVAQHKDNTDYQAQLGRVLADQNRHGEAVAVFRPLVERQPDNAANQASLGASLVRLGKAKEALPYLREAVRLQPETISARVSLGNALMSAGDYAGAEKVARDSLAQRPNEPSLLGNLGAALKGQNKLDEAEKVLRAALKQKPDDPNFHFNLAYVLSDQGRLSEAEASYRSAIGLKQDFDMAHVNLASLLGLQARHDEAEVEARKAVRLNPQSPTAFCNLGMALQGQGRLAEAVAAFKQGHELGSRSPGWKYPSAAWLATAERLVELEPRLPALLAGDDKPAHAQEMVELAYLCRVKKQYAAGVGFYVQAFEAQPALADDARMYHFKAASLAILAGFGRSDEPGLDDKQRLELRQRGRAWLLTEMSRRLRSQLTSVTPASRPRLLQIIRQWQENRDLAVTRDPAALARLPESERQFWQGFWEDFEVMRMAVEAKK